MVRTAFPKLSTDFAALFAELGKPGHNIGMVGIDNAALMQDKIIEAIQAQAGDLKALQEFMAKFNAKASVPNMVKRVEKWRTETDAAFWAVAKAPIREFVLRCKEQKVLLVVSSEESNVWENYGQTGQRVVGKKGKLWDVWMKYADAMVYLKRDVNKREAPTGQVNPQQAKQRIQGLNPTWRMDWPSFVAELETAKARTDEVIPEEAKVVIDLTTDEPEPVKAQ
jgi:hypothetical protein